MKLQFKLTIYMMDKCNFPSANSTHAVVSEGPTDLYSYMGYVEHQVYSSIARDISTFWKPFPLLKKIG